MSQLDSVNRPVFTHRVKLILSYDLMSSFTSFQKEDLYRLTHTFVWPWWNVIYANTIIPL